MGLHVNPIQDYTGDEESIDVDGIARRIDTESQKLTIVDPTGELDFHFTESWDSDISEGDYVQVRGMYDDDVGGYTIVGIKVLTWKTMSDWQDAGGELTSFYSPFVIRMLDAFGWLEVNRKQRDADHGEEVYASLVINGPIVTEEFATVPETYVFTWELEEKDEVDISEFAGETCFQQIFKNARSFDI